MPLFYLQTSCLQFHPSCWTFWQSPQFHSHHFLWLLCLLHWRASEVIPLSTKWVINDDCPHITSFKFSVNLLTNIVITVCIIWILWSNYVYAHCMHNMQCMNTLQKKYEGAGSQQENKQLHIKVVWSEHPEATCKSENRCNHADTNKETMTVVTHLGEEILFLLHYYHLLPTIVLHGSKKPWN